MLDCRNPRHGLDVICVLLALLFPARLFGQSAPPAKAAKPNVILITIDTLRADRLGCYGHKGIETPNLDGLAADGIRFAQAVAEVPITLPSHCSILTGTYPLFHGVRDNSGYRLTEAQVTLAEVLKANGYRTGAFIGAYVLAAHTGLNRGFDAYVADFEPAEGVSTDLRFEERRAADVIASSLSWIKRVPARQSFFAWIHLFDPHAPYAPPAPFSARYARNPYDGEVAYTDYALGNLFTYLKSANLYSDSLITMISDHGEGLGEHGEESHGLFLYDTTLRIPWILKAPGGRHAGRVLSHQVESTDLMPTVLQFLGIQSPRTVQGVGQLSAIDRGTRPERRYALGETMLPRDQYGWSPLLSLRSEDSKFIQAPRSELYDLVKDPAEKTNLYAADQALASKLRQIRGTLATQFASKDAAQAQLKVSDPELFGRLLGLGYVALSPPSGHAVDTESLPDPKDKVRVFDELWKAAIDSETGRREAAVQALRGVLAVDPGIYFARMLLGLTYFQMGRLGEAAEELRTSLKLRPNDVPATFYLGMALARLGQNEAAGKAFRGVLDVNPENPGALNNLGIVFLNERRYREAEEIYRKIVAAKPRDSFAWTNLGLACLSQGRNADAVEALTRAAKLDPALPQIHNNLGLALMNSGDLTNAVASFRKAIGLNPDYGQAHYNLALTLKKQGKDAEADQEMQTAHRLLQK